MITIIFKDDVKGEYDDYVKYLFGTIKNYYDLFPDTEMPLKDFTKEEFDDHLNKNLYWLKKNKLSSGKITLIEQYLRWFTNNSIRLRSF